MKIISSRRKQLCSASIDGTTQSTQNVIFYLKNKLEKNVLEKENDKKAQKKEPFFQRILKFYKLGRAIRSLGVVWRG